MKIRGDGDVKKFALLSLLFALVLGAAAVNPVQAELIDNGSFESPGNGTDPFKTYDSSVIPPLTSWTVVTNNVDVVTSGWSYIYAYDGNQFLDLVGSVFGVGAISQTFATVPGQQYALSFAYAKNVAVEEGPVSADVIVTGLELTTNMLPIGLQSIFHSTASWTLFNATFTAVSTQTKLLFSETKGFDNGGIILDAVSVNAVPLPPSILLLGSGLLGAGLLGGRRKRKLR